MKLKTLAVVVTSSTIAAQAFAAESDIQATDTLFGTPVSNTATLTYKVGGTDTSLTSDSSHTVVFNVDRRVIFSLTDSHTGDGATDAVLVTAGGTATTNYTLTNDSNAPISFRLPTPSADTVYTYTLNGVAYTPAVANVIPLTKGEIGSGSTDEVVITVTQTIPDDAENGSTFITPFSVTAIEPTGNINIPDVDPANGDSSGGADQGDLIIPADNSIPWNKDVIQTITSIPNSSSSILIDGQQLFEVEGASIALEKTVTIVSDPINGTSNPKAIPGAVIRYSLTVSNSGKADALDVTLSDDLSTLIDRLNLDTTASSSAMFLGTSTTPMNDGTADLKATLDSNNILIFPAVTVPKIDGSDNGIVTATFEAILK